MKTFFRDIEGSTLRAITLGPVRIDIYRNGPRGVDFTLMLPKSSMFIVWYWPGRSNVKTLEVGLRQRV